MGNTCPDICDSIINLMCRKCPNFKKCQHEEDDANHDQMQECIGHLVMSEYPDTFEDMDGVQHKRGED